jgi:hypothetical protein
MHPFRRAIENGDTDGVLELFAPEVVFNSPVVFRPYHGREALGGSSAVAWPRGIAGFRPVPVVWCVRAQCRAGLHERVTLGGRSYAVSPSPSRSLQKATSPST